jgi:hypothetical protein
MKSIIFKIGVLVLSFVYATSALALDSTVYIYPLNPTFIKFKMKFGKRIDFYLKGESTPKATRVLEPGLQFFKSGGVPVDQFGDGPVVAVSPAQQKEDSQHACDKALLVTMIGFWKHARKHRADAVINLVTFDETGKEYPSDKTFACVVKGQHGGVYIKGDVVRLDD